jgi:hypothetical protein
MTLHTLAAPLPQEALAPTQSASIGFSLNDVARFEAMMSGGGGSVVAAQPQALTASPTIGHSLLDSKTMKAFFDPLGRINQAPEMLLANSQRLADNPNLSPGDMIMAMVSVQKFVFECQLTSSVANRTSDGVQELFRQQA